MADPAGQQPAVPAPREESALHHAGYGLHERGTHHGWHRSRSWTVEATTHPARTLVGAGAAGLGVLASRLPEVVR